MIVGGCTLESQSNQKVQALFLPKLNRGDYQIANISFHILFPLQLLKITSPVLSSSISPHRVQAGPDLIAWDTWKIKGDPGLGENQLQNQKSGTFGPIPK